MISKRAFFILSHSLLAVTNRIAAEDELESFEQVLLREGAASLAKAAQAEGDAKQGAILFHQRRTSCS